MNSILSGNKKIHVLTDMDEVLVNISPKWIMNVYNHPQLDGKFNREKVDSLLDYYDDFIEALLLRDEYYIEKWLEIEDESAKALCRNIYEQDNTFYDDLGATHLANELRFALARGAITLTVISHCVNEQSAASKKKKKKKFFDGLTVEFICVPLNEKKSDEVIARKLNYQVFIDDMVKNAEDIMTLTGAPDKNFMVPYLGYNMVDLASFADRIDDSKGKVLVSAVKELDMLEEIAEKKNPKTE